MRLNTAGLEAPGVWEKAGIILPRFDRKAMIQATEAAPSWVHFGAGNIFRVFPAALHQRLLEEGLEKTGIIMVAGRDGGIIDSVFRPCDNLTLGVTLKADGGIEKRVIASIADALWMGKAEDWEKLKGIFRSPSLRLASLTITEKGYNLRGGDGEFLPAVRADFESGPGSPENYIAKITALLYGRFTAGGLPLALVSMDNCSHNGDKLYASVSAFASAWEEKALVEKGFTDYIGDRARVSFPWSMIDKITPGPDVGVKLMLEECGFEDTEIYSKTTPTAPFVNAEETGYLVIEDAFPAGRPALEKAGVFFTARETVDKVEKMKVCTCLNPLHTALAIFGCLLGYKKICDEMKDEALVRLVKGIGYKEGLPVVVDPQILSPKEFLDEVVGSRIPNPFLPDTPQRIAADCSQKIPVRFGETIKAYRKSASLDVKNLRLIPLVLAAWVRYLLGVDDEGRPFPVSPDPLYESLAALLKGVSLGEKGPFHETLRPILSNAAIFALDLYEAGLGEKVEGLFAELVAGPGAVRRTLLKCLEGA
jgi:fructuronate reductase